jgi:hypothetical protein
MRLSHQVTAALLLGAIAVAAHPSDPVLLTVNDAGDEGPGNCDSVCTLRDAIATVASGGVVDFAPQLLPATITLTQHEIAIPASKTVVIKGPGAGILAVSAASTMRLFSLAHDAHATLIGMTLRDGAVIAADGSGGASLSENGKPGEIARGGCFLVNQAQLTLQQATVRHCLAKGGNGGKGASGVPKMGTGGGPGGNGGQGGTAEGGAIYAFGGLVILDATSIVDTHAIGGKGGGGGAGYLVNTSGTGGNGGGAQGGASLLGTDPVQSFCRLLARNATIAQADATGGGGGNGGNGDASLGKGGDGGDGGAAVGGAIQIFQQPGTDPSLRLEFSTLGEADVMPGLAGVGGSGHANGADGAAGAAGASAISGQVNAYVAQLYGSAVFGSSAVPRCALGVVEITPSLADDMSCNTTLQAPWPSTFAPLATDAELPTYRPVFGSPVIDAASSCDGSDFFPVKEDAHETPRPQGGVCDVGAIEADYIFVDGFGG